MNAVAAVQLDYIIALTKGSSKVGKKVKNLVRFNKKHIFKKCFSTGTLNENSATGKLKFVVNLLLICLLSCGNFLLTAL